MNFHPKFPYLLPNLAKIQETCVHYRQTFASSTQICTGKAVLFL